VTWQHGFRGVEYDSGIIYGGNGKQLAMQLLGGCIVVLWTTLTIAPLFFLLRHFGMLRMPTEIQVSAHVRTAPPSTFCLVSV
jgi:ammonia channel protein AmtB